MDFLRSLQPSPLVVALILVGGIVLLWFAMRLRTRTDAPSDRLSTPARVFLVLLRLVIGWHFLIEGMEKLESPTWSSEGYLRESSGPLAPHFRKLAGDNVIAQLSLPDDKKSLPPALLEEWQRHFDAFTAHHKLDDAQIKTAQAAFEKSKAAALVWLTQPRPVTKIAPYPPELVVEWNVPQRLEAYGVFQAKLDEAEAKMPERGPKSWSEWKDAKANLSKWRGELKKDLDGQTAAFKKSLDDTLSAEQKSKPAMPKTLPRPFRWDRHLDISDAAVKYGLVAIGGCLIFGVFTRLAAFCGAMLLLSFYLAMPALPYLPESPKSEGHYLYVNKNIIEMIALLALASLQTGRWAGLDGILQFFNPFNWPRKKKAVVVATTQTVAR
jgi:uncharacterized membrane protein YphA (DoxX/SURF4 family)